jgi:hypothetical protein
MRTPRPTHTASRALNRRASQLQCGPEASWRTPPPALLPQPQAYRGTRRTRRTHHDVTVTTARAAAEHIFNSSTHAHTHQFASSSVRPVALYRA